MKHTVVGMFDNFDQAQNAVEKLKFSGFASGDIDISQRKSETKLFEGEKAGNESTDENIVIRFFRHLFGSDENSAKKFARVAYHAGTVVSVHALTEEDAHRAADILDENGAIDVNDRAEQIERNLQNKNIGEKQSAEHPHHTHFNQHHKSPTVIQEITHMGERTSPGTGVEETGASRSKSRVIRWKGEASARLREDRLTETRFW